MRSSPFIAVCGLLLAGRAAAQQTDVIRGRVTGPDSLPVSGAQVTATSYAGGISKTASTDRNGRYTIVFINGEGDYWLEFRKLGLAMRRFEIKKVGDEEVMIGDARMQSTIAELDAINVTAQRDRALPNRNSNPDVGGGEKPLTNTSVFVSPDQAGNLAAMAAAVAGVQLLPGFDGAADMFSVLGLTGDQNNVTYNGLGSGVAALPPDILATTSINPYPFDPSIGGFSGAQVSVRTIPGSNFSRRGVSGLGIAPALEWADAAAAAQGQKYTNMRVGGNAAGPISLDRVFYNGAYNVQRRFKNAETLLNAAPAGLEAAGVAPDSVARLMSILAQRGIPTTSPGVPGLQAQNLLQGAANFDIMPSSSGAGHSFEIGALGNYSRSEPVSRGGTLLTTPSHGGESSFWGANIALVHSNYFWFGILTKTTLGVAASSTSLSPFLQMPEGSVNVASTLDGGATSVKPLAFGGNATFSSTTNQTVQALNQLSWYSADNTHTIKIMSSIARDGYQSDAAPSMLGTYSFNSLGDLAAGAASSYVRTLTAARRTGSQLVAAASLGDYWRPRTSVQVQYGLRVDANRFLDAPAFNQALLDSLGIRNDRVPNRAYVSPRIGLQWYYGDSPQIAYVAGAARPPRAVVHAGIGVFQNVAASQLVAAATQSTGLASSTQSIACVGPAIPFPDWNAFLTDPATIPSRCADGGIGSLFASHAPNVTLFDAGYRQPRAVRAAADWSSAVLDNRFVLGAQVIVSTGVDQSGFVDANLDRAARFTLPDEAARPVFADASAIVPATGSVASLASRATAAFQRVTVERSDLSVATRMLSLNLKPVTANPWLKWDLTYTVLDAQQQAYGFTSTAGDPFSRFWQPREQAGKHTVTLSWSDMPLFDLMYITTGVRLLSGQRYTPMIAGDVNGDGFLNDRAYVFDPNATRDSTIAAGMRTLLASGAPSARACLERQLGHLSSEASCRAPWTAVAGLTVKFNPQKIGLPKRLTVQLSVQNPLGIADLALHGTDGAQGWGQAVAPDENLLYVRGFDPGTRAFRYEVNQRFGSTRPQQSTMQSLPFVSLSFGLDIGVPRERQLLEQRLDMGRGRPGTKQPAESMKLLGVSTIPNPMRMILEQQDSLRLTRRQADSLATLSYAFNVVADSVWTPVANAFSELGESYDAGAAYHRYVVAREHTVDYLMTLVPAVKELLTPSQQRKLPPQIANFLDVRVLRFLRSSTAGDNVAGSR